MIGQNDADRHSRYHPTHVALTFPPGAEWMECHFGIGSRGKPWRGEEHCHHPGHGYPDELAKWCYEVADAMLNARGDSVNAP